MYTIYSTCLLTVLRKSQPLLIATDGSKSDSKCSGSCVISTLNGKLLDHGANSDFSCMANMYPHWSEAHAILRVHLCLREYSKYSTFQIINKINIYCDNKEIVTKVDNIRSNTKYYDLNYNMGCGQVCYK